MDAVQSTLPVSRIRRSAGALLRNLRNTLRIEMLDDELS